MKKTSEVIKQIVAQSPSSLASKGNLIFRMPLAEILLGVYVDLRRPLSQKDVGCVIIPLCRPVDRIYLEDGQSIGFNAISSVSSPTSGVWNLTRKSQVDALANLVTEQLMPHWNELADVGKCIEYLKTLPHYRFRNSGVPIVKLVSLAAYQRDYEQCLKFVAEWREYLQTESGLRSMQYQWHEEQKAVVETIERHILRGEFVQLREYFRVCYKNSIARLGLSKYSKLQVSD